MRTSCIFYGLKESYHHQGGPTPWFKQARVPIVREPAPTMMEMEVDGFVIFIDTESDLPSERRTQ